MTFPMETFPQLQGFFWILIRISVVLFLLPLFGAKGLPTLWKAGVSLILAMILLPVVPIPVAFPETTIGIVIGIASEAAIGFFLAFGVRMLLASVQIAGQFMAFQMGFAMARAIDPQTGANSTVLSQFLYLFTILIFFTIDGHHLFIRALAASFQMVPLNSLSLNPALSEPVIKTSADMLYLALRIASPIMIALFLSNLCLGIVARTVPQVNILMIGFPINISLGLICFGLILSNMSPFISELVKRMGEVLMRMLRLM